MSDLEQLIRQATQHGRESRRGGISMTLLIDDTGGDAAWWDAEERKLVRAIETEADYSTRVDLLVTYEQVFGPWAKRPGPAIEKGGRLWPG